MSATAKVAAWVGAVDAAGDRSSLEALRRLRRAERRAYLAGGADAAAHRPMRSLSAAGRDPGLRQFYRAGYDTQRLS